MVIDVQKLILILVRITSFILVCPGFSFKGLPNIFKIALSASITIMVYMVTPELVVPDELLYFFILAVKEVLFGLAIGYVSKLVFATIEIAGQLIDFQVGFSMASVYDPSMGANASNYGRIYYWISICIFFILDMHHKIIATLIQSFTYIPLGTPNIGSISIEGIVNLFAIIFELALNLAAPMIIVVLVTDMVLGVISKTVPQINVLMLGMPLKATVSFFFTLITLSWITSRIGNILETIPGYMEGFVRMFR